MWCYSGSPVLFFAVVAFVVCRRRRVIFLRGAVYDGRKDWLFKDHRAVELIMSSPDPSAHKRIGRGVRNCDSAAWDTEKQNALLSGNYAKFTQSPAMKHHLLRTGNKRLAEASPLDPVWGIGLRADDPRAKDPRQWRGKNLPGEALSAVREEIRDKVGKPGLRWSVPYSHGECWNQRNFARAAVVLVDRGQRLPTSSLAVSDLFLGRASRPKPGRFGDSFWRQPWACPVRPRPLHRRGYCGARRRFVHYQICNT